MQEYVNGHTGPAKTRYLRYIASVTTNKDLERRALKLAAKQAWSDRNFGAYKEIIKGTEAPVPESKLETAWEELASERAQLENRVAEAKSSGRKDELWQAHLEFGSFHASHGNANDALKAFMRMRDCSEGVGQTLQMCLRYES